MIIKPELEDIENVCFGFAQALIARGGEDEPLDIDSINYRATDMAITWLKSADKRQLVIEQHFPNWLNLQDDYVDIDFAMGESYWIVGKTRSGKTGVFYAKLDKINHYAANTDYLFLNPVNPTEHLLGLYALALNDGSIFNEHFQPKMPMINAATDYNL